MSKLNKTLLCGCLTLLLFFTLPFVCVFASDEIVDLSRQGSISIAVKDKDCGETLPAQFILYKVADIASADIGVKYKLSDEFANSGLSLDDIQHEGPANEFYDYVVKNNIQPYKNGSLSENRTVFYDLPLGLYLIVQSGEVDGYFPISPFLVTVPIREPDGSLNYHVVADSKPDVWRSTDISVKKVWNVATDEVAVLPESVSVQLLRQGTVIDTVVLNAQNDWTYTWKDLAVSDAYSVKEINIPKDYVATYSNNNYSFTVTNSTKLPQTGQLFWPIPVFSVVGILFMMFGWAILHSEKRNDEKKNRK